VSADQTEHERADLAALLSAFDALMAGPEPDAATIERLADRAQQLAQSGDTQVAADAERLQLRMLGALLACRAAALRGLAQQLQHLAHMLPPAHPERN
jgi:hypothetical protein